MRYLLLRSQNSHEILAFTSFMLTPEEGIPVIYVYEIHLSAALRGSGIGKKLMGMVEGVGKSVGVEKCMLTVFTSNTAAEGFYRRLGYAVDRCSPTERVLRGGRVKRPEYLILSKRLDGVVDA